MLPGIYERGVNSPGSLGDNIARRQSGWPGFVYRLRFCGVYLRRTIILQRYNPQGLVVCSQFDKQWQANLHDPSGSLDELLHGLADVRLVKQRADGCQLLAGVEWDDGYLERWPQTWLCAPTRAAGEAALNEMHDWLQARYTGKG